MFDFVLCLSFVPNVVGLCSPINIVAFTVSPEEQRCHTLSLVRAVCTYVDRTVCFRRGNQLFVTWAGPHMCRPVTKQRFSHWVVEAIVLAYTVRVCSRLRVCRHILGHFLGLVQECGPSDICATVSWSLSLTLIIFL